jgi:hypothetical protein
MPLQHLHPLAPSSLDLPADCVAEDRINGFAVRLRTIYLEWLGLVLA